MLICITLTVCPSHHKWKSTAFNACAVKTIFFIYIYIYRKLRIFLFGVKCFYNMLLIFFLSFREIHLNIPTGTSKKPGTWFFLRNRLYHYEHKRLMCTVNLHLANRIISYNYMFLDFYDAITIFFCILWPALKFS